MFKWFKRIFSKRKPEAALKTGYAIQPGAGPTHSAPLYPNRNRHDRTSSGDDWLMQQAALQALMMSQESSYVRQPEPDSFVSGDGGQYAGGGASGGWDSGSSSSSSDCSSSSYDSGSSSDSSSSSSCSSD